MRGTFLVILASAFLLPGCMRAEAPVASESNAMRATAQPAGAETLADADLERAKRAAREFSTTLKQRLMAGMQAGGPVSSIVFCKDEAFRIASEMEARHGVKLGRVPANGKLRNPKNSPAGWQQGLVDDFQAKVESGQPPDQLGFVQTSGLPPGVALRFAKAITVAPECLICHGSELTRPVREALGNHYPNDRATGLQAGDLRGALWVEVPKDGGDRADRQHSQQETNHVP